MVSLSILKYVLDRRLVAAEYNTGHAFPVA
jgi:hypothetical protein